MNLDELIEALERIRDKKGGAIRVYHAGDNPEKGGIFFERIVEVVLVTDTTLNSSVVVK